MSQRSIIEIDQDFIPKIRIDPADFVDLLVNAEANPK